MPMPYRPLQLLLLAVLMAGASAFAVAAPQHGKRKDPRADAQGQHQPAPRGGRASQFRRNDDAMSASIRRVEQATRGQVLSAERVPYDGRSLNRIKVVDGRGRVRVYMDDPAQGDSQSGQSGRATRPTRGDDD